MQNILSAIALIAAAVVLALQLRSRRRPFYVVHAYDDETGRVYVEAHSDHDAAERRRARLAKSYGSMNVGLAERALDELLWSDGDEPARMRPGPEGPTFVYSVPPSRPGARKAPRRNRKRESEALARDLKSRMEAR